ncbi:DUF4898 domain-containing protein, partial [Sulfolobus sp. A20-N-F8]
MTSNIEVEDYIIKVARTLSISDLRAFNTSIVSDYQKFFDLILPKDVINVLVVLPLNENDMANKIREAISKVRPSASLTIMYSKNASQKIYMGY